MSLDIRAYIRDELRDTTPRTPSEIAATVLTRLDERQRAEAAEVAIPALVREVLNSTRPAALRGKASQTAADHAMHENHCTNVGGTPSPAASETAKPKDEPPQGRNVTPIKGKSWKRDGIRANWRKELDARYPDAAGRHKPLGDFSSDELGALAARCRHQAEANMSAATRWDSLATLVRAAGVARLADVDESTLAYALGGAA